VEYATVELSRDLDTFVRERTVMELSHIAVLDMISGSAFIQLDAPVDPHIDKAAVGVKYCVPHLVDASFIPWSHWRFQFLN
jgi:hypothetical protein